MKNIALSLIDIEKPFLQHRETKPIQAGISYQEKNNRSNDFMIRLHPTKVWFHFYTLKRATLYMSVVSAITLALIDVDYVTLEVIK